MWMVARYEIAFAIMGNHCSVHKLSTKLATIYEKGGEVGSDRLVCCKVRTRGHTGDIPLYVLTGTLRVLIK